MTQLATKRREMCIRDRCWFMVGDEARGVHSRYRYLHAKYLVIDDRLAAVSSENFSPDSLPDDDKRDGTWGRRGVVLITDARAVAAHLAAVFADDLDAAHADLRRWTAADPVYGAPPPGFCLLYTSLGALDDGEGLCLSSHDTLGS